MIDTEQRSRAEAPPGGPTRGVLDWFGVTCAVKPIGYGTDAMHGTYGRHVSSQGQRSTGNGSGLLGFRSIHICIGQRRQIQRLVAGMTIVVSPHSGFQRGNRT